MKKKAVAPDVMFRFDEPVSREDLANGRMLDKALNLGHEVATQHARTSTRLDLRGTLDKLENLGRKLLSKENIGVRREGYRFSVSDEAVSAFSYAYRARMAAKEFELSRKVAQRPEVQVEKLIAPLRERDDLDLAI